MDHKKNYLGQGWSFPPGFVKGSGVELAAQDEDIRQSLEILFSTAPGERIMRPGYGAPVRRWVFTEITLSERSMIADAIEQAVLYHEPRIEVLSVRVSSPEPEQGVLQITLDYQIRQTNSRSSMVFPFYFREGTDL